MSQDEKRCLIYNSDDNFIYISLDKKDKPEVLQDTIESKTNNITSVIFTDSNKEILITSDDTERIIIFDLVKEKQVGQIVGHTYPPTSCFLYRSNIIKMASFANNELIFWSRIPEQNSKMWKQQFMFPMTCKPIHTFNNVIKGIIYNNKMRKWTPQLVKLFTEEYGDDDDDEANAAISLSESIMGAMQNDMPVVKGPMNLLFPHIVRQIENCSINSSNL